MRDGSLLLFLGAARKMATMPTADDVRATAIALGDEVFVALRRAGKEVEYARYEGEGHSPIMWSYAKQSDFCNRVIGWFEKHLKK